jgi:hypothetical protein
LQPWLLLPLLQLLLQLLPFQLLHPMQLLQLRAWLHLLLPLPS